jgi:sulfate transport system ATP-binding protein
MVYVRPHRMHIDRAPGGHQTFASRVRHINPAGPIVKVELTTENGQTLQVEISHDRLQELALNKGEAVFVSPLEMRVFNNGAGKLIKAQATAA